MISRVVRPSASAAGDVFAGAFVAAHPGEHDPPECMVGLAVPAGVESMAVDLARGCGQGCDTAEVRERGFGCGAGGGCHPRRRAGSPRCGSRPRRPRRGWVQFGARVVEELIESGAVGFEREDASTEGLDREFRGVGDGVAAGSGAQCGGGACQVVAGHVAELFAELVGGGEAKMADLVQVFDADVAGGTPGDEQRPDRFHVTIGRLRDAAGPTRQRRSGRFDRVDRVGLARTAAQLTVRAIDLDHLETVAAQSTGRGRHRTRRSLPLRPGPGPRIRTAIGAAGRSRPVSSQTTRLPTPRRSRPPPRRRAHPDACRLHPSPSACSLRWSSPSLLCSSGQGVARASRDGDRGDRPVGAGRSVTLRNGACPISARTPVDRHLKNLVHPMSQTSGRAGPERSDHQPPIGGPHELAPTHTHWQLCPHHS